MKEGSCIPHYVLRAVCARTLEWGPYLMRSQSPGAAVLVAAGESIAEKIELTEVSVDCVLTLI